MTRWILASLLLVGCPTEIPDPDPTPTPVPQGFSWGDAVSCAAPLDGVGLARFAEVGVARGLTEVLNPADFGPTHLLVEDVDADGDSDIVVGSEGGVPRVYVNDGDANFERFDQLAETGGGWSPPMGLADLNGDGLPEIVLLGNGSVSVFTNRSNGWFTATARQIWGTNETRVSQTMAFGDLDGDGDLDIAAPHIDDVALPPTNEGTADHVLLMEGIEVQSAIELFAPGRGSRALVATFTDFDVDGDQDLFVPSDLELPAALWRNNGNGGLEDVAAEVGADVQMGAMGIDSADFNGDGRMDYCISDTKPPRCLASDGIDQFIDVTATMGLVPDVLLGNGGTIGWSIELADLDNDGLLDVAQSSAAMHVSDAGISWPDLLWHGTPDGFVDVTDDVGFGDTNDNYALATADMDGDGWLDILVAGTDAPPRLWLNQCGSAHWMAIELDGPPSNTQGFGARVRVIAGGVTTLREVNSMRAQAQTPSRVHVGLGEATVADVIVIWPDGSVTQASGLPADRVIRVAHAEADD